MKNYSIMKYALKRILLMFFTLFVIVTICFMLIRILPRELPMEKNLAEVIQARWDALGYNEPLLVQFVIYIKNVLTKWDFGTSWYISFRTPATEVISSRLLPTVLLNIYSMAFAIPLGIAFGIYAAIKKNKWQDNFISTAVMVCVSVPVFVYAFLVQYFFYFKWGILPLQVKSLADAGGTYFSWVMFHSMIAPTLALSFGEIASLTRSVRAELTESLTSDYMLLARTKGLTRAQATVRHALKNAMVPIFPRILSGFIGILGGSFIIENIFSVPGVGMLYLRSIQTFDYDVFMADCFLYTFIGLAGGILVDLSYGFIDPRIRMGER